MLTAVITTRGDSYQVDFVAADEELDPADCEFTEVVDGVEVCTEGPNPVVPELDEGLWGGISFLVLFAVMSFVLYPVLKKGMDARYERIEAGHVNARTEREAAVGEVAAYEAAVAEINVEAHSRVEAARETLEQERSARLGELRAELDGLRAEAAARTAAAREAASGDIAEATTDVVRQTLRMTLGREPDDAAVRAAVDEAMGVRS